MSGPAPFWESLAGYFPQRALPQGAPRAYTRDLPFDTSDATIRGSSGSSSLAAMLHLDALWKHTEPRFRDQDTWHGGYLPGEHKSVLTSLVIPDKELRSLEELVDARRRAAGEEPSPAAPRILSGVDLEFALQLIVPEGPNRNDALPSPE